MKIVINEIEDSNDCDQCGGGYATGFEVTMDGNPFGDFTPVSHCYGGASYDIYHVMKTILESMGHTVEFT